MRIKLLCTSLVASLSVACAADPDASQFETVDSALSADLDTDTTVNLADHITQSAFPLPSILDHGNNHRTFGYGGLSPRTYTTALSGGRVMVGLNTNDARGKVILIDGDVQVAMHDMPFELCGLVGHEDGSFGALLRDRQRMVMYMVRFDANGAEQWRANLNRGADIPRWELGTKSIGDSRLAYGHGQYQAFYTVCRPRPDGGQGHHLDQTMRITDDGVAHQAWGIQCSHSMGQLIAAHPRAVPGKPGFMTLCVADYNPGKGLFAKRKSIFVGGGTPAHEISTQLGQVVPNGDNWLLAFNAATPYSMAYEGKGVAVMKLDRNGNRIGSHTWLTNAHDSHVARGGRHLEDPVLAQIGDTDQFLVGWRNGNSRQFLLTVIDADGNKAMPEQVVGGRGSTKKIWWGRRDASFRRTPEGDIVWVAIKKWGRDTAGRLIRLAQPRLNLFRFSKDALQPPFALAANALAGANDTTIDVTITADDAQPTTIDSLEVEVFSADGSTSTTQTITDVALVNGSATVDIVAVDQHAKLRLTATIDGKRATREVVTLMRPDLTVSEVRAAETIDAGETLNIEAIIAEQNQDLAATADVVLELNGVEVDRASDVEVGAGATVSIAFAIEIATAGTQDLTVRIADADPTDYDTSNDSSSFSVEVLAADNRQAVRYGMFYNRVTRDYESAWSMQTSWYSSRGRTQYVRRYESFAFTALGTGALTFPVDRLELDVTSPAGEVEHLVRENVEATRTWGNRGYYFEYDVEAGRGVYLVSMGSRFYASYTHYASDVVYFSEGHTNIWGRTYSYSYGFSYGRGEMMDVEDSVSVDLTIEDDGQAFGGVATMDLVTLPDITREWSNNYWWGSITGHNNIVDRVRGYSYGVTEVGVQ